MARNARSLGKRVAAIAGLIFALSSGAVHAQACGDGQTLQEYRKVAHGQAGAAFDGSIKLDGSGALNMAPISAPPPSNAPKFAAFLLPATMFIKGAQVIDLEANPSGATPALPKALGMLLVPTAANDCRFFLTAPPDFDYVIPANDARRKGLDEASASVLLDAIFRSRFPSLPPVNGIVDGGTTTPAGRALFAQVMSEPILLADEQAALPPSVGSVAPTDLPPFFDWQLAMRQFAWPESLRAMVLKTDAYWARILPTLQRHPKTWTEATIRQDLSALEDAMRALKPSGELAKADLDSLVKFVNETPDLRVKALYGQQMAQLDRVFGNGYTVLTTRIEQRYSELYAASTGATPVTAARPFDATNLIAFRPKAATKEWDFKTILVQNATTLLPLGAPDGEFGSAIASAAGKAVAYLVFRDAPDPSTGKARVQPELVLALPIHSLLNIAASELNKQMPAGSCALRYSRGDVRWDVRGGQLTGNADVEAQVWACVTHRWVCFHGWKPNWCDNKITTRLFKTHGAVSVTAESIAIGNGVSLLVTANVPYQATKTISFNKTFRQPVSRVFTIPPVEMESAFFARPVGDESILWVVTARMPPMEPGIAAVTVEAIKAYLAEDKSQ